MFIAQNYSFIKLRKMEDSKNNTDLESDFQLNNTLNKRELNLSTLCLLISTNCRYEGYSLNLNLRQRFFKGNFKCLLIGSLINLTFPITFLGSNVNILKSILEGNNFVCQDLKFSNNSTLIYNNELFKRNDSESIFKNIKILCYSNIFNKIWNGLHSLNSSLEEVTFLNLKQISKLMIKDLKNFSSLYFLNVKANNSSNLKKIIELKLLKFNSGSIFKNLVILDQNSQTNHNYIFSNKITNNYWFIPSSIFYENEETFVNTEGLVKRTIKLISRKKNKNNWQILRKLLKFFSHKLTFLTQKDNQFILFNSQKFYYFKNFMMFQYYPTRVLSHMNFYFNIKNKSILLNKFEFNFKQKNKKFIQTKIKYWLDDFFNDGKDEYSENSRVLVTCSKVLKLKLTNFYFG